MNWARIITILAIVGTLALVQHFWLKTFKPPPGTEPAGAVLKGPAQTLDTIQAAVKLANSEAKTLVFHFSLENCGPCQLLDDKVLDTHPWMDYAHQNLKLINLQFPAQFTEANQPLVKNMELMESICKTTGNPRGFPLVAVFSSEGRVLGAKSGYANETAPAYISWVEELRKQDPHRPTKATVGVNPNQVKNGTNAAPTTTAATNAHPVPIAESKPANPTNAPVAVTTDQTARSATTNAPPESFLTLKGLSGGRNAVAMISTSLKNYTVTSGDALTMQTPAGKIRVKCVTVSSSGIVLDVGEGDASHRMTLSRE